VTETLESEAGIVCYAGIGRDSETFDSLSDSYKEAVEALQTGLRYHLKGRVFSYSRQTLERLTDLIPEDRAFDFTQKIITREAEKTLSEEMLEGTSGLSPCSSRPDISRSRTTTPSGDPIRWALLTRRFAKTSACS
ncbi:MAG: hypothetical protein IJI36_02175, partial [Kiritimatiellae bacterium]|nr:hypothetical protein [Kiritimatiellia bacterium]